MIQRKQTLFLIASFILMMVCMCSQVGTLVNDMIQLRLYNLWIADGQGNHNMAPWPMFALALLSAVQMIVTIFIYKRRVLQARLCLLGMFILVAWYDILAVLPHQVGGSLQLSWPAVLPAISIVLLFFARKGILSDEKLVRSLDRIR